MPEVDSLEADAAKEASFEQEVGRVLLQWGQSSEGLQEMLLQVRSNRHSRCITAMAGPLLLLSLVHLKGARYIRTLVEEASRQHESLS